MTLPFMKIFSSKVGRNIAANQMGFVISVIVTLFLSPFIVHTLGSGTYGIWSLIVSLSGHYGLLTFGIQGAVTRFVAHAIAKEDRQTADGYITTAFFFLSCTALVCMITGFIISMHLSDIFSIDPIATPGADHAFLLVSLTMAATFFFAIFQCNLYAHQRFDIINGIGIFSTFARAGLTVLVLNAGYGLLGLAAAGLFLTVITGTGQAMASLRFSTRAGINFSTLKRSYTSDLVQFGAKSFLITISITLIYQCDLLVIGVALPPEQITLYSLAATLITYLIRFTGTISGAMNPHATERFAREGTAGLRSFYAGSAHLMYMIGGLAFAGCFVLGKAFFSLWIGPEFAESGTLLYLLLIPQFFSTGYTVFTLCFGAMNRIGWVAVLAVLEGLFNLGLSLALVSRMGIYGVAVGTLVPLILNRGIIGPLYGGKKLNLTGLYLKALLPGFLIAITGILAGILIRHHLPPVSWPKFCVNVMFIAAACGITAYPVITLHNKRAV